MSHRHTYGFGLAVGAAFFASGVAQAQSQASQLEEIVVTAEKRQTNLQDTPLAISALSGEELASRGISDVEALAQTLPNVNFGRNVGFARIAIRGIGLDTTITGQEGRVAYHLDGVYVSRPTAALGTFFDVARVEVVRGPQGTLYGRNATAGAINVITEDPDDEFGGFGRITVGNYDLVGTEGALNVPLGDALAGRLAFETVSRGGYGKNRFLGTDNDNEESYSLRGKLKWRPTDSFDLTFSADFRNEDDRNYVYHYFGPGKAGLIPVGPRFGGTVAGDPRDSYSDTASKNDREFRGATLIANWDLGGMTLTSILGYRDSKNRYLSDVDNTQIVVSNFNIYEESEQFSEELRLSGSYGRGDWLVGAYYFKEEVFGTTNFTPITRAAIGGPVGQLVQGFYFGGDLGTDAYAVFGQGSFEITDTLNLVLGGRYSSEEKSVNEFSTGLNLAPYTPGVLSPPTTRRTGAKTWRSFTPKVSLEYQPNEDILMYATYSRGFKSGGFNLGGVQAPFDPEELTDYEVGLKADWLDGRLRTNLSAFYYDYQNLQVQKVVGTVAQVLNAASAKIQGAEAEITALPIENLQLELNVSLLDSEYEDFRTSDPARLERGELNLSGNQLSQAPNYTVSAAAEYRIPMEIGGLSLRAEGVWVDKVYFSPFNVPEVSEGAHAKFNASARFEDTSGRWTLTASVRNITDEQLVASSQVSSSLWGFPILGALEPPRTYQLELGYRF